jgi:hypothetical protein
MVVAGPNGIESLAFTPACTILSEGELMDQMKGIVRLLEKEKVRLTKELRGITAALAAFGKVYVRGHWQTTALC